LFHNLSLQFLRAFNLGDDALLESGVLLIYLGLLFVKFHEFGLHFLDCPFLLFGLNRHFHNFCLEILLLSEN
jgi:hypothetical protein